MIAGLYMDEFAEMHTKDLEVRQRISGVIPCAGVSACFSREAIQHLNDQNQGEAFRTSSFTEDYDIAFRVSELGFNSAFIAYPANYAIDIDIDSGNPGILYRTLPVATREFFPSGLEAAYRQRARWLLGIVFQGSEEHGWKGSLGTKYFLARDRKGVITSPAVMLAYFALANLTVFELYRAVFDPEKQFVYTLLTQDWAVWMFFANFLFLIWRLFNRMTFTGMIYNVAPRPDGRAEACRRQFRQFLRDLARRAHLHQPPDIRHRPRLGQDVPLLPGSHGRPHPAANGCRRRRRGSRGRARRRQGPVLAPRPCDGLGPRIRRANERAPRIAAQTTIATSWRLG